MIAAPSAAALALALLQEAPTPVTAGWASTLADVATIVIAVALVIVAVVMVPSAFSAGRIYRRINGLVDRLHDDTTPILLHLREITNNLNYISASIRNDVESFKGTIHATQERLTRAGEVTEKRINDFNALLTVVQEEAETLFIDTASTIRGVRAGTSTLRAAPEPLEPLEQLDALDDLAEVDWVDGEAEARGTSAPRREPPRY